MDETALLDELLDLADRLGVQVRREWLSGDGGGLVRLRGQSVLFVDLAAPTAEQLARTAAALATVEAVDDLYISPQLRDLIDRHRATPDEQE